MDDPSSRMLIFGSGGAREGDGSSDELTGSCLLVDLISSGGSGHTVQLAGRDFPFPEHDHVLNTPEDLCTIPARPHTSSGGTCSPTCSCLS